MDFINENIFIKCSYETYLRANKAIPFQDYNFWNYEYIDLSNNCALWEQFQIIPTRNNNQFFIKSYNNKYIRAEPNGKIDLSSEQDAWETFEITEENNYYLIKSATHNNRFLTVKDSEIKLMDQNENLGQSNLFSFIRVQPNIGFNSAMTDIDIDIIRKELEHYEKVQDRGKLVSRNIKYSIIKAMNYIIQLKENTNGINVSKLFEFSQEISNILNNDNNDSLRRIYMITLTINGNKVQEINNIGNQINSEDLNKINKAIETHDGKIPLHIFRGIHTLADNNIRILTNQEIHHVEQKIREYSKNYFEILQSIFYKYEQDFEEPLLTKRWWYIWLIQILTLGLSILINYLIKKYGS